MSAEQKMLTLDLRGLKCPLPVLRTRKALETMKSGELLEVLSTDPMAAIDIPHLLRQQGDHLLEQRAAFEEGAVIYIICKA